MRPRPGSLVAGPTPGGFARAGRPQGASRAPGAARPRGASRAAGHGVPPCVRPAAAQPRYRMETVGVLALMLALGRNE